MPYYSVPLLPQARETPFRYSFSKENFTYEIALRTASSRPLLKELPAAHHLVQSLLKGELLGQYELLDFLIWPKGLSTRVTLKGSFSLSEFLTFLKEKSAPTGDRGGEFWDEEPRWIKLITSEKLSESTESFLRTAERIHQSLQLSGGLSPNLFFFYRNSSFTK